MVDVPPSPLRRDGYCVRLFGIMTLERAVRIGSAEPAHLARGVSCAADAALDNNMVAQARLFRDPGHSWTPPACPGLPGFPRPPLGPRRRS